MKQIIILFAIILGMISCNLKDKNVESKPSGYVIRDAYELEIITIDSCEYLFYFDGNNPSFLTHKGNCKNHKK